MARYTPLLEIVVGHDYYADRRCRGLRFVPSEATAAWLAEVDALPRDSGSGLLLLADAARLPQACHPAPALVWTLHADDAGFAAVTEGLPPRQGGAAAELMVFAPAGTTRLHTQARAGTGDLWPRLWPAVSEHLTAAEHRRPPLGLVRLPAPQAPVSAAPPRYTIDFAARAPVWKYCIVGHWSDDPLEVVATNGAIAASRGQSPFGEPRAETLPDGRPVLAFLSHQGIELRERPERRFALRSASDQRVLLERLPMAGAEHFAFEPIGEQRQLVSEIFVHR